jgi:hypothetical protein
MKNLLVAVMVAGLLGGCYLGRTPARKAVAIGVNGGVSIFGLAMLSSAGQAGDEKGLLTGIALIPILVGAVGIAIDLAVPSEADPPRAKMPTVATDFHAKP